jgi:hypothetical protein
MIIFLGFLLFASHKVKKQRAVLIALKILKNTFVTIQKVCCKTKTVSVLIVINITIDVLVAKQFSNQAIILCAYWITKYSGFYEDKIKT